jgi:3-deoxy-manno-octulosonate cytidylyltransferase (CMP-KDO synthetase)
LPASASSTAVPRVAIIVPGRLASTRFPRKLLHPVRGRPLILWTAHRLRQEVPEIRAVFAVDGEELAAPLRDAGYEVMLTAPELPSGADRVAAANRVVGASIVVNVQADEPLVGGGHVRALVRLIEEGAAMATLAAPLEREQDYLDPNVAKCVVDARGRALFFTRAPVPFFRDNAGRFDPAQAAAVPVLAHIGLYAYRAEFLEEMAGMPEGRLERLERLEQLRVLEAGGEIAVGLAPRTAIAIDTPEQADAFTAMLAAGATGIT